MSSKLDHSLRAETDGNLENVEVESVLFCAFNYSERQCPDEHFFVPNIGFSLAVVQEVLYSLPDSVAAEMTLTQSLADTF